MNLRAVIVDDEFPAREELKCILEEIGHIDIVGECEDGDEALTVIQEVCPDVVFLDIQMRNKDGLVTAGEINEMAFSPVIVFTTGFSQYAVTAFELNAVDYILKPYSRVRVQNTIDRIRRTRLAATEPANPAAAASHPTAAAPKLCVWAKDRIVIVRPAEIFFAKADESRFTLLYTVKGVMNIKMTLKDLEEVLRDHHFMRTHKSYLVNLDKISEVVPWFNNTYVLVMEHCQESNIPVARHYIKEFNKAMGIS